MTFQLPFAGMPNTILPARRTRAQVDSHQERRGAASVKPSRRIARFDRRKVRRLTLRRRKTVVTGFRHVIRRLFEPPIGALSYGLSSAARPWRTPVPTGVSKMTSIRRIVAFAAAAYFAGLPAQAADRTVQLQSPPAVAKEAAAMPMIVNPSDDAERRINGALKRLDANLGKAIRDCKGQNGGHGDWVRKVEPTMRGPGYLSYVIRDTSYCGGAYPSSGTMAIVYDLRTGAPVDWTRLLPPKLTGHVALAAGMDGTKMVTLAAPRLYSLYLSGYDRATREPGNDIAADDQVACKEAVQTDDPPAMMVWLDAKAGGLAIQFDLPHAAQACAVPVVIPAAVLRAEGANAAMLEAIGAGSH